MHAGRRAFLVRDRVEAGLGGDVLDVGEVGLRRATAPHREIAPSYCPHLPVEWQRTFHLTQQH